MKAYADPEPGGIRWTVGYGATGQGIGPDTVWTQAQADADLARRLGDIAEDVRRAVKVDLSDQQLAALTDFTYNVGRGAFGSSTMLELLNQGKYEAAANQFPRWKYDDGEVMAGLVTRRRRERSLFLAGHWQ